MARVLGVGGIFFKTADPAATREWYSRVLGLTLQDWGGVKFAPLPQGSTTWAPFAMDTDYFAPSDKEFVINFVVDDLNGVLEHAATHDVIPYSRSDYDLAGRFAWILDPDGTKIELWQPLPS